MIGMKGLAGAAMALAAAGGASAQTSPMYVISQDSATIGVLQGGALINSFPTGYGPGSQYLGALAVNGDIRFTGTYSGGPAGTRLTLSGAATGDSYAQPGFGDIYDGTTDGKYIYTVGYSNEQVYRMNLDYTGATPLFNSGGTGTIGITYDSSNDTLWTHDTNTSTITNWTMGGGFISQYTIAEGLGENWRGLAYDAADGTLWLTEHSPVNGRIRQVSTTGAVLNEYSIPGLASLGGIGPLAAEFDLGIPAPGTLGLLGVAGVIAARRRR